MCITSAMREELFADCRVILCLVIYCAHICGFPREIKFSRSIIVVFVLCGIDMRNAGKVHVPISPSLRIFAIGKSLSGFLLRFLKLSKAAAGKRISIAEY